MGRSFFSQKFMEFNKDGDGLLSTAEQVEMFSTAPTGWVFPLAPAFHGISVQALQEQPTSALALDLVKCVSLLSNCSMQEWCW